MQINPSTKVQKKCEVRVAFQDEPEDDVGGLARMVVPFLNWIVKLTKSNWNTFVLIVLLGELPLRSFVRKLWMASCAAAAELSSPVC